MYQAEDFISKNYKIRQEKFSFEKSAPSNIALVKYWGKFDGQIPMNPSVSLTLNKSKTLTKAIGEYKNDDQEIVFEFFFEGKRNPDFEPKIYQFLNNILDYVPFIKNYKFVFDSQNTFPHSSGIASSASGFAALAKIIVALEKQLTNEEQTEDFWLKKTSFLARLGSGSAARSIEHPATIWGKHPDLPSTSDGYAVKPDFEIHPVFKNFKDSIVLVEKGQKKVSSSAGHQLMNHHPYKEIRKKQAFANTLSILKTLKNGAIDEFIRITEAEALSLHALMMTSNPNYILMQPETLKIIHAIRDFRKKTDTKLCFTLDAGANVHVLYPEGQANEIRKFLSEITEKNIIHDEI